MTVTVALPLGDITANQLRSLADIVRRFTKETIRTGRAEFSRFAASKSDVRELFTALNAVGLGDPGAARWLTSPVALGTDTCKLGIFFAGPCG